MRSMTGFGQATGESERFQITVTLRGVNHRFLDLSLRLRDALRPSEPALRELLKRRLWRGRVEVSLEVTAVGSRDIQVSFDDEVAASLRTLGDDLRSRGVITGDLSLSDLLRLPEVVKLQANDPDWSEDDQATLLEVTERALDQMVTARVTEGGKLAAVLSERLRGLAELGTDLATRWEGMGEELSTSLRGRIGELVEEGQLDEDRLAQEVAYLVDRSDVREELDRLQSHLEHFTQVMKQDGSVGKRLDFLTQEILRELNTLGAKCRDSEMTRWVLDGKVLCEQLREQVQNVE